MNRGTFLATAAAAGALVGEPRSKTGMVVTSYLSFGRPKDTIEFLEHANAPGVPAASRCR
jgi:hypothetical protein